MRNKFFLMAIFMAQLSVQAQNQGFFGRLEASMGICPAAIQMEGPDGFQASFNPWFILPAAEGSASAGYRLGPASLALGASLTGAMFMLYLTPMATIELDAGKWTFSGHLAGSTQRLAWPLSPVPLLFFLSWPSADGLAADLCVEYRFTDLVRLYGSVFYNRQAAYDGADHLASLYPLIGVRLLRDWPR